MLQVHSEVAGNAPMSTTLSPGDSPALVGRSTTAAVRIADPHVSREHAWLVHDYSGTWRYRSVGARGSFVEGEQVVELLIDAPTRIALGGADATTFLTVQPVVMESEEKVAGAASGAGRAWPKLVVGGAAVLLIVAVIGALLAHDVADRPAPGAETAEPSSTEAEREVSRPTDHEVGQVTQGLRGITLDQTGSGGTIAKLSRDEMGSLAASDAVSTAGFVPIDPLAPANVQEHVQVADFGTIYRLASPAVGAGVSLDGGDIVGSIVIVQGRGLVYEISVGDSSRRAQWIRTGSDGDPREFLVANDDGARDAMLSIAEEGWSAACDVADLEGRFVDGAPSVRIDCADAAVDKPVESVRGRSAVGLLAGQQPGPPRQCGLAASEFSAWAIARISGIRRDIDDAEEMLELREQNFLLPDSGFFDISSDIGGLVATILALLKSATYTEAIAVAFSVAAAEVALTLLGVFFLAYDGTQALLVANLRSRIAHLRGIETSLNTIYQNALDLDTLQARSNIHSMFRGSYSGKLFAWKSEGGDVSRLCMEGFAIGPLRPVFSGDISISPKSLLLLDYSTFELIRDEGTACPDDPCTYTARAAGDRSGNTAVLSGGTNLSGYAKDQESAHCRSKELNDSVAIPDAWDLIGLWQLKPSKLDFNREWPTAMSAEFDVTLEGRADGQTTIDIPQGDKIISVTCPETVQSEEQWRVTWEF